MKLSKIAATAVLVAAGAAQADTSLLDFSMYATLSGGNGTTIGAVTFASAAGNFITKTKAGISGLGVTGGNTNDEIDIGETITMSWVGGLKITSFSVGVLYNGREFSDWAEIAKVKAYSGASLVATGYLQVDATIDNQATFTNTGFGSVGNLSPATLAGGGGWKVDNPFGNAMVDKLVFTAKTSALCGTGYGTCTNQSDYILSSVTAVPEPGTYAMLLAGLGALGFVARRRKLQA